MFSAFNAGLVHLPKGRKGLNRYGEPSHETDDDRFYVPYLINLNTLLTSSEHVKKITLVL